MDGATVTVLTSLFVGGSATVASAWVTQKTLNRRELIRIEAAKRETLYGEFITETSRLLVDALTHTLEKPETLLAGYALLNRIRLCASAPVLREAEQLFSRITDQYFSKNLSLERVREMVRSDDADPLHAFGEACRAELSAMRLKV